MAREDTWTSAPTATGWWVALIAPLQAVPIGQACARSQMRRQAKGSAPVRRS
jgi:hypothetical protein